MASSGPGRFGDEDRKRREAFVQHNGWVVGNLKYLRFQLMTPVGIAFVIGLLLLVAIVFSGAL